MKIVFVTAFFGLSGGARVVAIYAGLLAKMGHQVTIVSQPYPQPNSRQRIKAYLTGGKRAMPAKGSAYLEGLDVEHRVLETSRPVVDADLPDADVVIATWWETAYWVAALSPAKGRKFHFVQGHEVFDYLPWQISRGSYYLPLKKIAVSKWLVDIMAREYGDHDVALVHNSVDMDQFHAPPRHRQAVPTVGLLYSPTRFKGVDISFEAIEKARTRIANLRLVAFGAQDPVSALPLPPGTRYIENPTQDRIRNIYANCDAWLFSSRAEGFGLPLLEAMACRTPVVATRAGAAPDLIEDGLNGYVVDVEDSDALADRLVRVLSLPPDEWQKMSNAALAVAEGYTWEDATARFERFLLEKV